MMSGFRCVRSLIKDIVARFPRGFYQHGGKTVILSTKAEAKSFEALDGARCVCVYVCMYVGR